MSNVFDAINRFKENINRDLEPPQVQRGTFSALEDLSHVAKAALTDHDVGRVTISEFCDRIWSSRESYDNADFTVKALVLHQKMLEGRVNYTIASRFDKHPLALRHKEPDFWLGSCGVTKRNILIRRTNLAVYCGYVALRDDEVLSFQSWKERHSESYGMPFNVHGGVTFEGEMPLDDTQKRAFVERGIPENLYWIGFDCAHSFDWTAMSANLPRDACGYSTEIYRDFGYVLNECLTLADAIETFDPSL